MDEDEFLTVIDAASKVVARVYSKKRLSDTAGIDSYKVILLSIAMLLAISFLVVIYLAIYYDNTSLEISAYAMIVTSFAIVLPLSLHECLRKSDDKFIGFNSLVKKELDLFFSKMNTVY